EGPPGMPEKNQRKVRMSGLDDPRELPDGLLRRAQTALTQAAELRGPTVLADAGAAMPAVVVGVDDEPGRCEVGDQLAVASGVLPDSVQQLHDAPRITRRRVDVIDDRDAVRVGE